MEVAPAVNDSIRGMWKLFPMRIQTGSTCGCCGGPMFLVQSMRGGFVRKNCKCGNSDYLSEREFYDLDLWIDCLTCKTRMMPTRAFSGNYAYRCDCCQEVFKLADLLPFWNQL